MRTEEQLLRLIAAVSQADRDSIWRSVLWRVICLTELPGRWRRIWAWSTMRLRERAAMPTCAVCSSCRRTPKRCFDF